MRSTSRGLLAGRLEGEMEHIWIVNLSSSQVQAPLRVSILNQVTSLFLSGLGIVGRDRGRRGFLCRALLGLAVFGVNFIHVALRFGIGWYIAVLRHGSFAGIVGRNRQP